MESAQSVVIPWPRALAFSLERCLGGWLALFGPLVLAGLVAVGLAIGGWVLLNWAHVSAVGAVLFPIFLIAGAVIAIVLIAHLFAHPLLLPAVACEGTDAIDAVQRAFAYVFARPLRLVIYGAILAVQLAALLLILGLIAGVIDRATIAGASLLLQEEARLSLFDAAATPTDGWKSAAGMVRFWRSLPGLIVVSAGVSYFFCASTLLYLIMRRVCDGQDFEDLWHPGMVEGTMATADASESRVAPSTIDDE